MINYVVKVSYAVDVAQMEEGEGFVLSEDPRWERLREGDVLLPVSEAYWKSDRKTVEAITIERLAMMLVKDFLRPGQLPSPYALLRGMLDSLLETPAVKRMRELHDARACHRYEMLIDRDFNCWFCRYERYLDLLSEKEQETARG